MRLSKDVKVIFLGAAAAAACLSFIYGLYLLPPARIYLGHADRYAELWPRSSSPMTVSLVASQRDCHLEYRDHLSPDMMGQCSSGTEKNNSIYLLGNSHAQHLIPMLELASLSLGYGYTALTISNCRLVSAFQVIESINYRYDLCKDYFDYSTGYIVKNAKPGDIVLIGARSLFDQPESSDGAKPSNSYLGDNQLSAQEAYVKSLADLTAFSQTMRSKRVAVIFSGPTPTFNLPATQCVPEWFRSGKSGCNISARTFQQEKKHALASVVQIAAASKNTYFWDTSVEFCDGDTCSPSKGDRLMFRDRHHLSVAGSESLAPSFLQFVSTIMLDKVL
jgi:hypothetical protein